MAGIIDDLNEINTSLEELKASKQRIRLAIESKLNTNIDPKAPINTYDDYIYKIKSEQEKVKLILDLSDTNLFSDDGVNTHPIIVDANGEPVDIDILHTGEVQQEYDDNGNPYSVAKYIKIEAPEGLIPGNLANNVDIFGIKGTGGWDPPNPTTAIAKYVISTTDPGEIDPSTGEPYPEPIENTFLLPSGERSIGTVTNKTNVTNLTGTLTAPARFNGSYVSSIGIKPNERYLVNNNSEFTVPLSGNNGVVNKVNNQLSLEDKYKILPENIKVGCNIFGVVGTYTTEESKPIRANDIRAGRIGYVNGEKITGTLTEREARDLIIDYDDYDTPEGTSTITVPVGIYGSLNVRYLRDAETSLTVNGPTITSSNPNNIYAAGGKTLTYNIVSGCTESGVIRQGAMDTSTLTITPRDVIPQEPFNTGVAAENNGVLQGRLYVDRNGNVKTGTMPPIYKSSTLLTTYTTSSNLFSLIPSSTGYYTQGSYLEASGDMIKNSYNTAQTINNKISPENIKRGSKILGVTGTYEGSNSTETLSVGGNYLEINFSGGSPVTFEAPVNTLYNRVKVYKDSNLTANNIRYGKSIYGIDGTFTQENQSSAANSWDLILGKAAYVNGERITGTIKKHNPPTVSGGDPDYPGYIYTKDQDFILDGYYPSGIVGIADSEKAKIISSNIRSGVTILGVTGNYTGGVSLNTIKDISLDDEYNIPLMTTNSSNDGLKIYQDNGIIPGINSRNRICWYTKNYNVPLSPRATNGTFIVPRSGNVVFNVIPLHKSSSLPSLVRVILNGENITFNALSETFSDLTNVMFIDTFGESDSYSEANYSWVSNHQNLITSELSVELPTVDIYTLTNIWDVGAFKYTQTLNGNSEVRFSYDEEVIITYSFDQVYKRYTIDIDTTGSQHYVDVSDTTATTHTVLTGYTFYNSDGDSDSGSIPFRNDSNITISKVSQGTIVTVADGFYPINTEKLIPNGSVLIGTTLPSAYFGNSGKEITIETIVGTDTPGYINEDEQVGSDSTTAYIKEGSITAVQIVSDGDGETLPPWLSTNNVTNYRIAVDAYAEADTGGWLDQGNMDTDYGNYYVQVENKTLTPSNSGTIYPINGKLIESVTITPPESNKIKLGETVYGTVGTYSSGSLTTKNITTNGTYNASDDNVDGYSQVTVNVPTGFNIDLTGTTWIINNTPELIDDTFHINFNSNNESYNIIEPSLSNGIISYVDATDPESPIAETVYSNGNWSNIQYKTITISGGTNASNPELVAWLLLNAVEGYNVTVTGTAPSSSPIWVSDSSSGTPYYPGDTFTANELYCHAEPLSSGGQGFVTYNGVTQTLDSNYGCQVSLTGPVTVSSTYDEITYDAYITITSV